MLLLPHPQNVSLTLSVHFSNFDSPLKQRHFNNHLALSYALFYFAMY